MTKLSDETDRRLTASAGYDSFVHCHVPSSPSSPSARCTSPSPPGCRAPPARRDVPNCLGGRERQLERRALDVIDEDVQVVGIDQRALGRARRRNTTGCARRTDRAARCWRPSPPPTGRCAGRRGRRAATSRQSCPDSRPSRRRRARRCRCRAPARWSRPPRAPLPSRSPFSISRRRCGR